MAVPPVGPGFSLPSTTPPSGAEIVPGQSPGPKGAENASPAFQNLLTDLVHDANHQQLHADQATRQLLTGETDSVHDVMLASAKAELAFRFVLEVRNRLIDAYQEIIRMQV